MTLIALDFEFNHSKEEKMNVVAAVLCFPTTTDRFNLLNVTERARFRATMLRFKDSGTFLAYAVAAETRALLAMNLDPMQFKWVDLYVEFRMLCNSNDEYKYGAFLDSEGVINRTTPPPFSPYYGEDPPEDDGQSHQETPKNLVNAVFRCLGVQLDVEQKTEMRDLLIHGSDEEILSRMDEVLEYCESDTKYLIALHESIQDIYKKQGLRGFERDQLSRGRYSCAMGVVENTGIPIDLDLLGKIVKATPQILQTMKQQVNEYFPFYTDAIVRPPVLLKNGKTRHFKVISAKKDMSAYQAFVQSLNIPEFPLTDSGKYKSDRETLQEYRYIPGLRALLVCNNTENNLKWFNPEKKTKDAKDTFVDKLGSDGRVRPYFGVFGTQTGRNAAAATTFPFAMSSWLRTIVQPPPGRAIIGSDFSQQEIYVAAYLSNDLAMMEAYNSGDVYLKFGQLTGIIPPDGTKATHKAERDLFKATKLGKMFGMGVKKLWNKLKVDSKNKDLPESVAQDMNKYHLETFRVFWNWAKQNSATYRDDYPLMTNDGWVLWQDNKIGTSVTNFPVQANAAAVTRHAVVEAVSRGIQVISPLHDAVYVECSIEEAESVRKELEEIMRVSTAVILGQPLEQCTIRIDSKIIKHGELMLEDKGKGDWEKLRKYFDK